MAMMGFVALVQIGGFCFLGTLVESSVSAQFFNVTHKIIFKCPIVARKRLSGSQSLSMVSIGAARGTNLPDVCAADSADKNHFNWGRIQVKYANISICE